MKQEEKELLLKDLCARLPYGVKCQIDTGDADVYVDTLATITIDGCVCFMETIDTEDVLEYDNIKPYLFPISSMTEEQKREYNSLCDFAPTYFYEYGDIVEDKILFDNFESIDYLIANHFDYRGLIEKGLAIDCTNLNVY